MPRVAMVALLVTGACSKPIEGSYKGEGVEAIEIVKQDGQRIAVLTTEMPFLGARKYTFPLEESGDSYAFDMPLMGRFTVAQTKDGVAVMGGGTRVNYKRSTP